MLQNFVRITFRGLARNWTFTLVNVVGLAIGISVCLIVYLLIRFETQFDAFHTNAERLYRVTVARGGSSSEVHSAGTPYPFIRAFRNDFPDIPLSTQFHYSSKAQIAFGENKMGIENILFADSLFFDVFSFGITSGKPHVDLGRPGTVFLTESLARKIDPDGKLKSIRFDNKIELAIVGTVADPPPTSHIAYTMIASMPSLTAALTGGLPIDSWGLTMSGYSYVVLPPGIEKHDLAKRFEAMVEKYYSDREKRTIELQPLSEIHFDESFEASVGKPTVSRNNLVVLFIIGSFILLIACINFINLSTALASRKAREIGVRKTLGANRPGLTIQYLSESLLIAVCSTFLALIFVEISLPFVGSFLEKELVLRFHDNLQLVVFLIGLAMLVGVLSGLYPALILSGFNPAQVMKSRSFHKGSGESYARYYLVMFQFTITQILIVGALVVANQLDFFATKPLGFTRESILNVVLPENKPEKLEAFRTQLEAITGVAGVSFSLGAPITENDFTTHFQLSGQNEDVRHSVHLKLVDGHYLDVYDISLIAGRWFSETEVRQMNSTLPKKEQSYHYVVNEALVRELGFGSPEELIGKHITSGLNDIDAEVIGVVKDFHMSSFHHAIEPALIVSFPTLYYDAGIRFHTARTRDVLSAIEKAYASVFPDYVFDFNFLDNHLASLYRQEDRTLGLVRLLSGLSIFVSCLGLLGLISFVAQQKIKEVGIRKVFGASVQDIIILFSRNFAGVILKASILAVPLSLFLMRQWLNSFAYQTSIGVDIFLLAIGASVLIALLTVAYQSYRSATANPVDSLRNE